MWGVLTLGHCSCSWCHEDDISLSVEPGIVHLHLAFSVIVAGIEFPASCAAGLLLKKGSFLDCTGRHFFSACLVLPVPVGEVFPLYVSESGE